MKEYDILRKSVWEKIPELEIGERLYEFPADIRAFCKVCYDDENLYVRLRAEETVIRAENTSPMAQPCEDSCLEFFFCPINGDERYFNIEYNPNKLRFLGIGSNIQNLVRLFPLYDNNYSFDPEVEYLSNGWQITYHVPYRFIRLFFPDFSPKSGDYIMANAFTTGDLCIVPHDISWSPVDLSVENPFHNARVFGKMYFK